MASVTLKLRSSKLKRVPISTALSNTPFTSAAVASRGTILNSTALNAKNALSAVLAYVCLIMTCAII